MKNLTLRIFTRGIGPYINVALKLGLYPRNRALIYQYYHIPQNWLVRLDQFMPFCLYLKEINIVIQIKHKVHPEKYRLKNSSIQKSIFNFIQHIQCLSANHQHKFHVQHVFLFILNTFFCSFIRICSWHPSLCSFSIT